MKLETAEEILRCYKENGKESTYDWYGKEAVEAVLSGDWEWFEF
jgi:hypothetical protein